MAAQRFFPIRSSFLSVLLVALLVPVAMAAESPKPSSIPDCIGARDGKAHLPDGSVYTGSYRNGLMHGKGRLEWPNGNVYEGGFRDGLANGRGRLTMSNGDRYEGEFHGGQMHGKGTLHYRNGDRYKGNFVQGAMSGKGELRIHNGDVYTGEFSKDYINGQGRYVFAHGDVYEGTFRDNAPNGKGRIMYENKSTYEGELKDWQMHGQGVFTTSNGDVYSGEFVQSVLTGLGEVRFKSGDYYKGEIRDYLGEGQGVMRRKNGEVYTGSFHYGQYDGEGKITYSNGTTYEGGFKGGARHGKGVFRIGKARVKAKGHKTEVAGWWEYDQYLGEKRPGSPEAVKKKKHKQLNAEKIFYQQPGLLRAALDQVQDSVPGKPEMYFVSFGADGGQDVFMKEARFAKDLFDRHLQTRGRSIALINNAKMAGSVPLASVTNLELALKSLSNKMGQEDILFLFLTSHGSKDHTLSVSLHGFPLNDLPAKRLAGVLRKSSIKWRVIVVSSCYSGGFINPLKDPYTMVLTASKSDHVSFGCTDEAEFTYFGRAFFKESVAESDSFRAAFEQAKQNVTERENLDKYSHSEPQIWVGHKLEPQLARWRKTLHTRSTMQSGR